MSTFLPVIMLCCALCLVAQSCSTLCDSKDCSPPGSSVHEIFQARILEWVSISFSRGSSQAWDRTCVSCTGRQILYHWATWEVLCIQGASAFSEVAIKAMQETKYSKHFVCLLAGCAMACGILVSWPGIESMPPALEVKSLNHWTTREVPFEAF